MSVYKELRDKCYEEKQVLGTANKTIHELESGIVYYNYQGNHFRVFEDMRSFEKWDTDGSDDEILFETGDEDKLDEALLFFGIEKFKEKVDGQVFAIACETEGYSYSCLLG